MPLHDFCYGNGKRKSITYPAVQPGTRGSRGCGGMCVVSTYHTLFHAMEAVGTLDPDNEIDLFALHCLYLPRINNLLEEFTKAWNKHPLRTEHNWSPYKIWGNSVICGDIDHHDIPELDNFDLDEEGPIADVQVNTVFVPETLQDLSEDTKTIFLQRLHDFTSSIGDVDPIIEFLEIKTILTELLETSSESDTD